MFRNYVKIAWRNLLKSKRFSAINIFGLTIGITSCMMIFLYIMHEFSRDKFHKQGKNIYRVMRSYDPSEPGTPYLSAPYATALLNDFPRDIKKAVRIMPTNVLVTIGNTSFSERKTYIADADFFSLFTFPLIKGNPATALKEPGSVVLTQNTAKKYFGNADPMGKVVEIDRYLKLKVTGIAQNVPSNSHLDFDLVVPISNYKNEQWFTVWMSNNNFTYVELDERTNTTALTKQFVKFMDKYMDEHMKSYGMKFELSLTPLQDIYFERASAFDNVKHGDKTVVYIFLSIAVLILLIACINFMNLSTIRAVERSKEVGLRKVLGALRKNLIWQFIGESVLITLISCVFSLGLLQLLMPLYNQLVGHAISVSWNTVPIYLFLIAVILVVGFLAGCYPAFFLSAFKPIESIKGKLRLGKGGTLFRQAFVVVQFSITVFLIIGTIVIMKQMHFVKNKELGYNKEQTVVIPIDNGDFYNGRLAFKNELQNNGRIASVSLMSGEPGGFFDQFVFEAEGQHEAWKARTEFTDFEYVKTLGLKLIAGRDFSPQHATDTTDALVINRAAASALGFTPDQAVGKWIRNMKRDEKKRRVIGVVEDFNFLSLKEHMDPLVIAPGDDNRVAVIRLKPGNLQEALAVVKSAYARVAPAFPLDYTFLDQKFDQMYRSDLRQQTLLTIFSTLAIIIACLGLFGLASFTAAKRTKEIGVRKVLGSSVSNIVVLLSKDLLKPVLIAALIAMPLGYYAMNTWLQNFAYRTGMQWWIFGLAAVLAATIALVTVSLEAIKAAIVNPVKSLRTE